MTIFELTDLVSELHIKYGKGDLQRVQRFLDGSIVLTSKGTSCKPHRRSGKVVGNTVYLYGRQRTWKMPE